MLLAAAVLVAVMLVPSRLDESRGPRLPAEPPQRDCQVPDCPAAVREALVARIEDHLFERMPAAPQQVQEAVARAIVSEAEAVKLDPLMVLAMIEVESGYDPAAASGAGARGLMQLLPSTMRRETEALGLGAPDASDPVANVRAGVRYLRRCLDSYPGHMGLALMAYNAGPNRVYELLHDETGMPDWALAYPRRVELEHRKLQRAFGATPGPRFADASPVR
jgi:hypothetical protein